jgi:hypothetical protein
LLRSVWQRFLRSHCRQALDEMNRFKSWRCKLYGFSQLSANTEVSRESHWKEFIGRSRLRELHGIFSPVDRRIALHSEKAEHPGPRHSFTDLICRY